uniref:Far upstream element-binding protein C-terminal domain-containing protein n=1 Tax=Timema monikensis TaxID=170555 RepID=A0A7R9E6T3_9NEOP|nr:unnamed protein product [Timema monikensis]
MVIIGCSLLAQAADLPRSTPLVAKVPLEAQHRLSKKKTSFHHHTRVGTAGAIVLSLPGSLAFLPTPSYVCMRTTVKPHVAGTVKQGPPQHFAPQGWGGGYQPWQNQPGHPNDPNAQSGGGGGPVQVNPATGQPDYSIQWAEYYRSLGMHREAEMIEQQAKASKQGMAPQQQPQAQPAPQPQPQPQAQPAAAAAAAAQNGQPDYSAQWAEYYRSIGKIKEAEAIEAQMKANKVNSNAAILTHYCAYLRSVTEEANLEGVLVVPNNLNNSLVGDLNLDKEHLNSPRLPLTASLMAIRPHLVMAMELQVLNPHNKASSLTTTPATGVMGDSPGALTTSRLDYLTFRTHERE